MKQMRWLRRGSRAYALLVEAIKARAKGSCVQGQPGLPNGRAKRKDVNQSKTINED